MTLQYSHDLIILGGGITGLTLACSLAAQNNLRIAVVENTQPQPPILKNGYDLRVSAITHASETIFQNIDVWKNIQSTRISPFRHMHVWDALGNGKIHFDSADIGEPHLGHIIENNVLIDTLLKRVKSLNNIEYFCPIGAQSTKQIENANQLTLTNNQTLTAKLIVGADGAKSWLRQQAGIALITKDYQHHALVANVKTELPHQQTAWQRFINNDILAFLPLSDPYQCSIVWSILPNKAKNLCEMREQEFNAILTETFAKRLGKVTVNSQRVHFPLYMQHARQYVAPRIALIGDAAHRIHPLAGQGLNLGLLDVACLTKVILYAHDKQRDIGGLHTLRQYERWRKGDNLVMIQAMGFLKDLFSANLPLIPLPLITWSRNTGLNMTDKLTPLKKLFMRKAMGTANNDGSVNGFE